MVYFTDVIFKTLNNVIKICINASFVCKKLFEILTADIQNTINFQTISDKKTLVKNRVYRELIYLVLKGKTLL